MITEEDVEKLALLARIALSSDEKKKLAGDITAILAYVSRVQDVARGIDAESREADEGVEALHTVMREDNSPHESGVFSETLMRAAPRTERGYVKVKKIFS